MILFSVHGGSWMSVAISDAAKRLVEGNHPVVIACWDERAYDEYKGLGHDNVLNMINLYDRHDYPEPSADIVKEILRLDGSVPMPGTHLPHEYEQTMIRRCSQAHASVRFVLDMLKPKVLVIWNNLSFGGRIFDLCADKDVERFYIERGPLAGLMQISQTGVNASLGLYDSLRNPTADSIKTAMEWIELYKNHKLHTAWPGIPQAVAEMPKEVKAITKPIVLWASQVALDTQIVFHSDLGYDYGRVYKYLKEAWTKDSPYQLVIKLHPAHYIKAYHDGAREIEGAVVVMDGDIRDYLALPNLQRLATVNSSVGFEALLYGIPTVTLGRNWYTRGMTEIEPEGLKSFLNIHSEPAPKEPWSPAVYKFASGLESGDFVPCGDFPTSNVGVYDLHRTQVSVDSLCLAIMRRES